MLHRGRPNHHSPTIQQFQQFIRKRSEKNNILHSSQCPIDKKVACFQQLLRLTKTGTQIGPAPAKSKQNIQLGSGGITKYQQSSDAACEKLDKMVNQVNGWFGSSKQNKQQFSSEVRQGTALRKRRANQPCLLNKKNHNKRNSMNNFDKNDSESPIFFQNSTQKNRPYLKVSTVNSNFAPKYKKTTKNSITPQQLTTCLIQNTKPGYFSKLRKEIAQLQKKAKNTYGLVFDTPKDPTPQQETPCIDVFGQEQGQNDEQQYERIGLELKRAGSLKQFRRPVSGSYQRLVQEQTAVDSSVPVKLLQMVRGWSGKVGKRQSRQGWASRYIRI